MSGARIRIGTILALAAVIAAGSLARAQDPRVWILNSDRSVDPYRAAHDAFRESWSEPTMDIDLARIRLDAYEVGRRAAAHPPAAVYCIGSKAYLIAVQLLPDRPVVLSSAMNWARLPVVPDRIIVERSVGIDAQFTLFRHFFPDLRRIGVVCAKAFNREWAMTAQDKARRYAIDLQIEMIDHAGQVSEALDRILSNADALWMIADPLALAGASEARMLMKRAEEANVPVLAYSEALLDLGAVLTITADDPTTGRQAAELLRRRLAQKTPLESDSPHDPAGTSVGLNLRRVREMGIRLNEKALDSVDILKR